MALKGGQKYFVDKATNLSEKQHFPVLIIGSSIYQIVDKPTIQNKQTFSTEIDSPKFRITDEYNQPNKGYDLFENPFGMWRLTEE